MNKKYKAYFIVILIAVIAIVSINYFSHHTVAVLQPRGPIALSERNLLLEVLGLMLIVVLPVFFLTFFIVWKYREGHQHKYRPDFDHSVVLEGIWWLIPTILIVIISIMIWNSSHSLDPFRKIASSNPPMSIEVVALDWKWLFIYPSENVASVNQLNIPINRPITFYITSDAPMNSFWIPQLGGQIYAMPGMSTQLNLMATSAGDYYGSSANISGQGFAGMHFIAKATSNRAFNNWVNQAKQSVSSLSQPAYNKLDRPSINNPVSYYASVRPNLYVSIIDKYMVPGQQMTAMTGMMQ